MTKFYFTSLFILFFSFGFSQSYPYLNASTGNENEFPVDKDTNIYMFHGNRLVKTDKNFNTIWANTYSGLTFSNVLLSKTGSIYFIGKSGSSKNYFGKINPNGSLNWIKNTQSINAVLSGTGAVTYNMNCSSIFQDRNTNLVITGSDGSGSYAFLLKTDTNGVDLKFKSFYSNVGCLERLTLLQDSAGYYKLFGFGFTGLSGYAFGMYTYSDISDVFTSAKACGLNNLYNIKWAVFRSKFMSNYYAMISADIISSTNIQAIMKFSMQGNTKWSRPVYGGLIYSKGLMESNNGDLLFSLEIPYSPPYKSVIAKVDSNGVVSPVGMNMLNNYPAPFNQIPYNTPQVIHDNNYYFDVWGFNFPTNPLTIQKFNSTFTYSCSSTTSLSNGTTGYSFGPYLTPTINPVTSFTVPSFSSSATPVTFSVNPNFCTVLNTDEIGANLKELLVYPNPSNAKIYIENSDHSINEVEIFDVNGKKVKSFSNTSAIDVADLSQGIYFIRIKTDRGEFNKKFIKE